MNTEEFFSAVSGIILHSGSLEELNGIQKVSNSGRRYALRDFPGDTTTYLTGLLIPSSSELELMVVQRDVLGSLNERFFDPRNEEHRELALSELQADVRNAAECIEAMLKVPYIVNMDLRVKAQRIGASGLIHVQPYANNIYSGIPVTHRK